MSAHAHTYFTEEQYLAIERAAVDVRSEFYNGEMYAMAGASRHHVTIVSNLNRKIGNHLEDKPCLVGASDHRVRVPKGGLYTYPDLFVACDPPQYADNEFDTLLNPTLLIEVLSPSTESYDRGFKAAQYREIPTLGEYALVSQAEPRVEIYLRHDPTHWLFSEAVGLDASATFASVGCTIPLREIYRLVTLDDPPPFPRAAA